jgi:hypothetical protein
MREQLRSYLVDVFTQEPQAQNRIEVRLYGATGLLTRFLSPL